MGVGRWDGWEDEWVGWWMSLRFCCWLVGSCVVDWVGCVVNTFICGGRYEEALVFIFQCQSFYICFNSISIFATNSLSP